MEKKKRNSSIELFRIIAMLVIVAHHYVVNSGILGAISHDNLITINSIFSILFGWGGKTGINCFVFITGYFMCKSTITLRKYLKLLLEIEFYSIGIYLLFALFRYSEFSVAGVVKALVPFWGLGSAFVPSFLVFYLFIPFLNILIKGMTRKEYKLLILTCLISDCFLQQTFVFVPDAFTYVGWFIVVYLISAYVRLHPNVLFDNRHFWVIATCVFVCLSLLSVVCCIFMSYKLNRSVYYWFVADSNKLLALLTAGSAFLCFKNLNIPYISAINKIAGSTFGVLLIHAHSGEMSRWLWGDVLKNTYYFQKGTVLYICYSVVAVLVVFIACIGIDIIRIHIIERPVMKLVDKTLDNKWKNLLVLKITNILEKW